MSHFRTWIFVLTLLILHLPVVALAGTTLSISPEKILKPVIRTLDDSANNLGLSTSIAIGRDGNPVISYSDFTVGALKLVGCSDALCLNSTIRSLDTTASGVADSSIVIGTTGFPIITYYDGISSIKLAVCTNVTCSATTISTILTNVEYPSMTIGNDGYMVIAYYGNIFDDLNVAKCNNDTCTSPTITTIDSTGDMGRFPSIAIGRDSYPIISYNDWSNDDLKFAKCNDASCSTFTTRVIDNSPGQVGQSSSITVGNDGYPTISYIGAGDLKLAKCTDASCSTPTILSLDTAGIVGGDSSITIGRNGYPVISYYDATNADLKLYICANASCSTGTTKVVDSAGIVGSDTSLAIGRDGYPVISYRDTTNRSLKFAYVGAQVTLNKTPPPSPKTAGGLVGWWTFDGKDMTIATATDRSGNGYDLTLYGSPKPSPVAGRIGQGVRVKNNTQGMETTQVFPDLPQKTISAWIRPVTYGGSSIGSIYNRGIKTQLYLRNTAGQKTIEFSQYFVPTAGVWRAPDNTITLTAWTHVAVSYDRTSTGNTPTFYINGIAVGNSTIQSPVGTPQSEAGLNPNVGNSATYNFDGTIDDVRVYNRILTPQEIKDLYNQTKGSTIGKCGPGPVLDADGNKYSIVQIGTQCWLDRNMNVGTRINGGTAQTNNATIEKYCYNDTPSNCTDNHPKNPDGGLYQWNEAMQYSTTEGVRGICPAGWHIPSDAEWYTLENYLKTNGQSCLAGRSAVLSCLSAGTKLRNGGNSLFNANLAGYSSTGSFSYLDGYAKFWSSTENGGTARIRTLDSFNAGISRDTEAKGDGLPVRCIKN